jgi:RNA polymerase sigma factor (sigma-70 family)
MDYRSDAERRDLLARTRAGDIDARNRLVLEVLGVARSSAYHNRWDRDTQDDILQEMALALTRTIGNWEPSRGALSTFAVWACRGAYTRWHTRHLLQTGAISPSYRERDADGMITRRGRGRVSVVSLSTPIGDDGAELADLIAAPSEPTGSENAARVARTLALLPERERALLVDLYGLDNDAPMTIRAIADRDGVTYQAIGLRSLRSAADFRESWETDRPPTRRPGYRWTGVAA